MASLPEKATHRQTRTFNQQLVLRAIYDRTEVSRAELARLTGLTRTSVSALVAGLLRDGLIEEIGRGPSTGGKQPILLRLRRDARHAIGLDLGESAFSGALVDMRGNVVKSESIALEGRDGIDAVGVVYDLIDNLTRRDEGGPLLGVAIGAPGLVDSRSGTVRWAVNLDWANLPLGQMVGERFGMPAVVVNDSQAAAVAESTYGAIAWPHNLIVIRVGRGIGAGIILGGQLYQGDGSGAGEIGHMTIAPLFENEQAKQCACGRFGCLETVASMRAMVDAAHDRNPAVTDDESLVTAFRKGDAPVCEVVLHGADLLGAAIAAMIAVLNVMHVLLIGPATRLGDEWLVAIRRRAQTGALPLLARDTHIDMADARADDVVIGASALLMTQELGLGLAR